MVLARAARAVPSLVIPDELSLTLWGHDPYALGLAPIAACGAARAVWIAEPMPQPLHAALLALEAELPGSASRRELRLSGPAAFASEHAPDASRSGRTADGKHHVGHAHEGHAVHAHEGHAEHHAVHAHEGHAEHGHEGHGDMMAIVGEPSADGLVMERIEFSYGPLLTPMPGGVVLDVELDGDVVSRCTARATLEVGQPSGVALVPDPLAVLAWTAVLDAAAEARTGLAPTGGVRWHRLAAVELERSVSHLAWLRGFARLLGWGLLVERVQPALDALAKARAETPLAAAPLALAGAAADGIVALLARHRAWTVRTVGVGLLRDDAPGGLYGPNLRAAGVSWDARADDPLYVEIGFEPVVEYAADARARTVVRAREAAQSIGLAALALSRADSSAELSVAPPRVWMGTSVVEGPRGPLTARAGDGAPALAAPGERAAIGAAGRVAIGREWASALVGVASLDLSPWRVGM
jgi:hypothetical protein